MNYKNTTINISRLNNANYYQWITNVVAIANSEPSVLGILQEHQGDIAPMQLSFKNEKGIATTQINIEVDRKQDRALTKLNMKLKSKTTNDQEPTPIDVANHLLLIVKNYGGRAISNYDFNKKTAFLSNSSICSIASCKCKN